MSCGELTEEITLEGKYASDWTYRGEGAANLVLAYTGKCPGFAGKVIRVQKVPRKSSNCGNGHSVLSKHERLLWKDADAILMSPTKEIAQRMYVQYVMIPLLGAKYVDAGVHVLVSREFLELVERNILSQRPVWRVNAAKVNIWSDSVLLMSDHSIFPDSSPTEQFSISVELKPKCGFLPSSRFIAEKNAIKKNASRFKMHQFLKLQEEKILQLSEYNPLDLFSGTRERIQKAIQALFATPQNNFRVFLNGSLIFGGLGANGPNLMRDESFEGYVKHFTQADDGLGTENFVHLVAETVYKSGIMNKLLEVQKLDQFDIEGAIHAYYNVISKPCEICKTLDENKQLSMAISLHSIPLDESVNIVKDYLVAATAKDCSIMLSFRRRDDAGPESSYDNIYLQSTRQSFDFKAFFIDLDLKPLKKMEHYYQLDQKIVKCYTKTLENKPNGESGITKAADN